MLCDSIKFLSKFLTRFKTKTAPLREDDLIQEIFKPLTNPDISFNLTDDLACVEAGVFDGGKIVVSSDSVVQGVHLFKDVDGFFYGAKLLKRNISDIIAKGAVPLYYNLNIVLPQNINYQFLQSFAAGLLQVQSQYAIKLIGGDTTRFAKGLNDCFVANSTIFGKIANNLHLPLRQNIKDGDVIFATNKAGLAFDGYLSLKAKAAKRKSKDLRAFNNAEIAYLNPELKHYNFCMEQDFTSLVSASMDVSDGLFKDLSTMLKASNLAGVLNCQNVCKLCGVNDVEAAFAKLKFGDDYILLFATPKANVDKINTLAARHSLTIMPIASAKLGASGAIYADDAMQMSFKPEGFDALQMDIS